MLLSGEYEPSPIAWVREQVETYERTGGREANTLRDTGIPIIVVTTRGRRSRKIRKFAVMRVSNEQGCYALIASKGGAPNHPEWYWNIVADPRALTIQDSAEVFDAVAREVEGEERKTWWERAVATYPPYAEYQARASRTIPVLVACRREPGSL
ncbi:nitroreductase family deazaflavin-dependent oxidoreductase [Aciditerrimonas ferrireducens]|jgi:deazaflavin-dependent oxidoreductase (nitroreductase family)|uniref:nitroreductase family deazaflavin-dependent oxidoreductase n=1 Tax=Aciditerrimonas ferrireducens TaxID=667306 RepID=UPI002005919B|nr:nitroreductase family deazaflavin-dependent oxidoreductase [Aciditerrimonas ferrireducens]MCK4176079.1 nitroreductase family deazaflavin-dependent oxidoreductase [Aciditerrimonas ferrireducens]